jgi:hypothetical protein
MAAGVAIVGYVSLAAIGFEIARVLLTNAICAFLDSQNQQQEALNEAYGRPKDYGKEELPDACKKKCKKAKSY